MLLNKPLLFGWRFFMKQVLLTILIFLALQALLAVKPERSPKESVFVSPPQNLQLLTFGFSDLMASLLWVRVLQDIDVCDQSQERSEFPAIENQEDPLAEILTREIPAARCEKGWVYQMLDAITDLAPDFRSAYTEGGTMLSILVDDREGASRLFAKGTVSFPDDWKLLYHAAYHELFEMQNPETAADLLRRAGQHGAPEWVFALSAKLYTRLGQAAFAKTVLERVLERKKEGPAIERVRNQLETINQYLQSQ